MSMVLLGLFAAGVSGPFFMVAWYAQTRSARLRGLLVGGLAFGIALCANPLTLALRHVDGEISMMLCQA